MTRKMKKYLYIWILCATTVLTGCIKDEYDGPDQNLPTRTVLFYLCGDNNLDDIGRVPELLRQSWSYTGNRCLIYYDAPDKAPVLLSLRGGCSATPTPYIETVAQYAEENSASADVLARVIRDVTALYPADSYGLVFSSHASGWLPAGTLNNPQRTSRSIGSDRTPGTMAQGAQEMELADFASAIPDGQFDFIIFECCLMAGVEVGYALRNKTDYIMASSAEMLDFGFTPIYAGSSHYLFDTGTPVETALMRFAQSYYTYISGLSGAYRSATLSIIRTAEISALAIRAKETLSKLHTLDLSGGNAFKLQFFDRPGSYGDYPASPRYFDFMDCMQRIATPTEYAELESLMSKIVVWKEATPTFMAGYNGFTITHHSGLTTYIEQSCFEHLNTAYRQTAWYADTR